MAGPSRGSPALVLKALPPGTRRQYDAAMIIRGARADDVDAIARMLRESAESQGEPSALCVTASDLMREGFGDAPRFQALVAEADGRAVGLALYVFHFSTWTSINGIHLE